MKRGGLKRLIGILLIHFQNKRLKVISKGGANIKSEVRRYLKSDISLSEKIDYLWMYYWKAVLLAFVIIALGGYFMYSMLNRNEYVFNMAVVSEEFDYREIEPLDEVLQTVFAEDLAPNQSVGISLATDEISIERFLAEWTAGEYDLILLEHEYYEILKTNGTFSNFKIDPIMNIYADMVSANDLPMFESLDQLKDMVLVKPTNSSRTAYFDEFFAYQELAIDIE